MKKILLAIIVIASFSVTHVNAQLQRGNVLVGGDIANFDIGLKKNTGYDIQLNPKAAWFLNDKIAIGPDLAFGLSKANKESSTVTDYSVGALARYYLVPSQLNTESLLRHTRAFFEGNVGISGRNVSDGGGTTNGLGLGIGPGIAYFITPSIGLEALLKYEGLVGFGSTTTQSNLNLSVGFQVYLPGRATRNKVMNDTK